MRLEEELTFTTLGWVKRELDETLKQAREALEAHAETEGGDEAQIRRCAACLHQVHGTLRMVELYGAALVADEMERVAEAAAAGSLKQPEEAYGVLMRGIMQMPDYLDRLHSGHRDIPIVLLPLLNDLRAARGGDMVAESSLFSPRLDADLPEEAAGPGEALDDAELKRQAGQLRGRYQAALLNWLKGRDTDDSLRAMRDVLDELVGLCASVEARRLWWIGAGVLDGLAAGVVGTNASTKKLVGRLDREIKHLVSEGETDFDTDDTAELTRSLLYHVAYADAETPRLDGIRNAFRLMDLVPRAEELEHARGAMSGHNRELLDTVADAIREDLLRVKDSLDLYLRTGTEDPEELRPLGESLRGVGDTLGMIGLLEPRARVDEHRQIIEAMADGQRETDEATLLEVAGSLLQVEASLDDHIARLGAAEEVDDEAQAEAEGRLSRAEMHRITIQLLGEATQNLNQAKDRIVAFIEAPWDYVRLDDCPLLLEEVIGALRMLDINEPAELLGGIVQYLKGHLIEAHSVPSPSELDTLADALESIEYYLEALTDNRPGREQALAMARDRAAALDIEPPARAPGTEEADEFQDEGAGDDAGGGLGVVDMGPGTEEDEAEKADHAAGAPSDDIDDEIRGVFVEEVTEELENLQTLYPRWKADPEDHVTLTTIRRVFHTLKGSGRLVGATTLGEFSWKVENMLNRVLEGVREPTGAVFDLMDTVVGQAVPQLLKDLEGGGAPDMDIEGIKATADRIAEGEEVAFTPSDAASAEAVEEVPADEPAESDAAAPMEGESEEAPATGADEAEVEAADTQAPEETPEVPAGEEEAAPPREPETVAEAPEEEPAGEGMDPTLYEIFSKEAGSHLVVVNSFLSHARSAPDKAPVTDDLVRSIHTLHGAACMADLEPVHRLTGPMESYVKRLNAHGMTLSEDAFETMDRAVSVVETMVERAGEPRPRYPDSGDLSERLERLRDEVPEPADGLEAGAPDEPAESFAGELSEAEPDADRADAVEDFEVEWDADDMAAPAEEEPAETTPAADAAPLEESGSDSGEEEDESAWFDEWAGGLDQEGDVGTPDESAPAAGDEAAAPDEPEEEEALRAQREEGAVSEAGETDGAGAGETADGGAEIDPELLEIFLEEGVEILDESDSLMQKLRANPDDREPITELQRGLHTLKGGARMAGLSGVGELSHVLESLFEALADGRVEASESTLKRIEIALDRLHADVERAQRGERAPMPEDDIRDVKAMVGARGRDEAEVSGFETDADADTDEERSSARVVKFPEREAEPEQQQRAGAASGQAEAVRVRSDLLDNLVNYAGEVSIYRARLEQQVGSFRFNLVELEQTVSRLRDQLRKLEIETETQILSRLQREGAIDPDADISDLADFDPLELDRFSQLQQYSRALAESVADLVSIENMLSEITRESETLLLQQSRVNSDLQEGLMRTRMVPFNSLVPRLRRLVRRTSRELERRARLEVHGAEGEMDRNVLERMTAPLEHMLRNSLAHGIEHPDERREAGKPEEGTIRIDVSREASEVVVRVADDGRGIDLERVRQTAIKRGLLKKDAELTDRDTLGFILETGFTTAESVSQVSGRGVGMDVVHAEIKQLSGSLDINSHTGQGTTFTIRLPFTLAVTQALMVRVGEDPYAVPLSGIEGVVRVPRDEFMELLEHDEATYEYADEEYQVQDLAVLLGRDPQHATEDRHVPVLIVRSGDQRAAIRVDELLGSREVVVKTVGPQLSTVPGIFGATILGDGSVVLILDLMPLVRRGAALRLLPEEMRAAREEVEEDLRPTIMVVDDSITMRKVTSRILERHDMQVMTAKDGVDAVAMLQENVPDVMLLDIEMPRMDGYELATHIRNDSRLKDLPIIMITSRTGSKHRERAEDIGVNKYLGKPYQETDLMEHINELLDEERHAG